MSSQEHVLYVVPVVPSANGSGIARRAFYTLQSLSTTSQVHVRWVDAFGVVSGQVVDDTVLALCASFEPIRPTRMQRWIAAVLRTVRHHLPSQFARWWRDPFDFACARRLGGTLSGHRAPPHCRRVVLFRLYLYPVASALLETMPGARLYVDLDDIESVTRQRIGGLYRARGQRGMAAILDAESQFYHELEARVLPGCDGVFVASAIDRERLAGTLDAHRLAVLPNVYPAAPPREAIRVTAPVTFLFIGAFGYFPNHDAAMWLCREVIPLVVAGMRGAVRFRFVGAMARRELQDTIAATAYAVYEGPVPDIDVAYREVDVAVVPIRGGGGTRIKLLEAFARGIPVVSTTVGAEGIPVDGEVHLLLADSPEVFAAQCLRLARSARLRESLAAAAMARWATHYRPEAIEGTITDLFERTS
jgi:glycosyltransferase involved in cell wall biosynthesis